jgi:hypothetical protein
MKKMDIIQTILKKLPAYIIYDNPQLHLKLFINHSNEMRLCYEIGRGTWFNPFVNKKNGGIICDYLYLYEKITSSEILELAVIKCHKFLKENKLA